MHSVGNAKCAAYGINYGGREPARLENHKYTSHNPLIFYLIIKVFSHRLYKIATEMMRVRHDLKPNDFLLGATIRGVK